MPLQKENQAPPMNRERLMELVNGFRISRVILTAFELDVFSALTKPRSGEEIAVQLHLDPRATDRLLRALCSLDLVEYSESGFVNSPFADKHLVRGREGYFSGLTHSARLWHSWGNMTESIRKGGAARKKAPKASRNWPEGFIAAMHERAMPQAPDFIQKLDLSKVKRILDIGAGSGAYTIALLRARPDIHSVCFDLPEVIPLTRKYVRDAGLDARVDFISGDFNRNRLGTGYDLVLLSAIIHMQSLEKNFRLFQRIHMSLASGGKLVIQDFIMDRDRLNPVAGTYFALNMIVNTADGDTFTAEELHETLMAAGFASSRQIVSSRNAASLMIASKG